MTRLRATVLPLRPPRGCEAAPSAQRCLRVLALPFSHPPFSSMISATLGSGLRRLASTLALAALVAFAPAALAQTSDYNAILSGSNEVPAVESGAPGRVRLQLNRSAQFPGAHPRRGKFRRPIRRAVPGAIRD